MRKNLILTASIIAAGISQLSAQLNSTPCGAGPLPNNCSENTIVLTASDPNSGITDPSAENGVGCNSIGSDITAGTLGNSGGAQDYDVWYTTTVDVNGEVSVYAAGSDPVVGIYTGPCGSPTLVTCDDDGGTSLDALATASGLTPGTTVWIRVWDYSGGTGTYTTTASGGTPPANDDCAGTESLTVNAASVSGTTYCATVEGGDPADCELSTENNVWYTFTTASDGDVTVNFTSVDCFGSGAGIDVTLMDGTCAALVGSYGCTAVGAGGIGSLGSYNLPAGTYTVMVDGQVAALCDFDVDVDFVGCSADAGTNTTPAVINSCFGVEVNVSTVGSVNTNVGADPCIGWGFWVMDDPFGVWAGMTGIGTLPSGGNPAGGGDPNYAGVWTSIDEPLANGPNAILPTLDDGVTYYIAPITLSDCSTGEITTNCFDVGAGTSLYFNPEITYTQLIDCDDNTIPTTIVTFVINGGLPSVDGSNFTISTNPGHSGALSTTTVAQGGTLIITGIADGGTVDITITDDVGCTQDIVIANIDAAGYCPNCIADAGTTTSTQSGDWCYNSEQWYFWGAFYVMLGR